MNEEKKKLIEEMTKMLSEMRLQSILFIKNSTDTLYNYEAMENWKGNPPPSQKAG